MLRLFQVAAGDLAARPLWRLLAWVFGVLNSERPEKEDISPGGSAISPAAALKYQQAAPPIGVVFADSSWGASALTTVKSAFRATSAGERGRISDWNQQRFRRFERPSWERFSLP